MPRTRYTRWAEMLHNACRALAGPGTPQQRLLRAASAMTVLAKGELPEHSRQEYEAWCAALTQLQPKDGGGALEATVASLGDEECTRLALELPGWLYQLTFHED